MPIIALRGIVGEPLPYPEMVRVWDLAEHASFTHRLEHEKHVDISNVSSAELAKQIRELEDEMHPEYRHVL